MKSKETKWLKIYTREYGAQYSQMMIMSISPYAKSIIPYPSKKHLVVSKDNNSTFYADKASWDKLAKSLHDKYTKDLPTLKRYEKNLLTSGKKYVDFSKKVKRLNLKNQSNQELLVIYLQYQKLLFNYTVFVATAFILNNYIADTAVSLINKYIATHGLENKEQELYESIFTPSNKASILKLQHQIGTSGGKISSNLFDKLYKKYQWISCQDIHNDPWTKTEFRQVVKTFKKQAPLKKSSLYKYARRLKIKKADMNYLLMAKRMVYIKDLRDDLRRMGVYHALPLFVEVGRRMKLKRSDTSYVLPSEIVNFLNYESSPNKKIIESRKKGFIMYLNDKQSLTCLEGRLVKSAIHKFRIPQDKPKNQEVKGRVASHGIAEGIVIIVNGIKDLASVKKNSVLVANSTHPDYTIAMKKAVAIITDEGGITSHAAIVAREYKIPCIVGTKNATKVLKNGDYVFVDAIKGAVRKIS